MNQLVRNAQNVIIGQVGGDLKCNRNIFAVILIHQTFTFISHSRQKFFKLTVGL